MLNPFYLAIVADSDEDARQQMTEALGLLAYDFDIKHVEPPNDPEECPTYLILVTPDGPNDNDILSMDDFDALEHDGLVSENYLDWTHADLPLYSVY